jgi:hypothetical protein
LLISFLSSAVIMQQQKAGANAGCVCLRAEVRAYFDCSSWQILS